MDTFYQKLSSFVVSTSNVFGCVKRLKNDQAFWDAYEKIKKQYY